MTQQDRTEVKEMLHDILAGHQALYESAITVTNNELKNVNKSLDAITGRLDRLNGKVAEHEKIININLPHSSANCPQRDTIKEIRDNMVGTKAMQKTIAGSIAATGTVFSILFILYKVFIEKQIV